MLEDRLRALAEAWKAPRREDCYTPDDTAWVEGQEAQREICARELLAALSVGSSGPL